MDTKKIWVSILITIGISFSILSTCKKSECISNSYLFKESWKILPQKDSINVGDTLFFVSKISNPTFDYNSMKTVSLSDDALIGTPFSIRSIIGLNNLKSAIDSFDYFLKEGRFKNNDLDPKQIKDILWLPVNNEYKIEIGLIARKRGNYSITLPDAIGKLSNSNNCSNGATIILSNANGNNNAYLSHPYYGLNYVPGTDSAHVFCIRVK